MAEVNAQDNAETMRQTTLFNFPSRELMNLKRHTLQNEKYLTLNALLYSSNSSNFPAEPR